MNITENPLKIYNVVNTLISVSSCTAGLHELQYEQLVPLNLSVLLNAKMEFSQKKLQSSNLRQRCQPFRPIYTTTRHRDQCEAGTRLVSHKLSKCERIGLVGSQRPDELDYPFSMDSKEYGSFNYTKMDEDTPFYIASGPPKNEIKLSFARNLSPVLSKKLQQWSVLEDLSGA